VEPEGPIVVISTQQQLLQQQQQQSLNSSSASPSSFSSSTSPAPTTFNNQPATAYPSALPPTSHLNLQPTQQQLQRQSMIVQPSSSHEEFRPTSYNPHLNGGGGAPGVFGQLKLGTPNSTPSSSSSSLPLMTSPPGSRGSVMLSQDGHLPLGGSGNREMHSVAGSWKKSSSGASRGGNENEDEEEELDACTRCCHISCEIQ
jgi:hypothetical protein